MRCLATILLAAAAASAGDLVYVGLNEQGAEEWFRVKDGATVIRIPGGEYRQRPYQGGETNAEPNAVLVKSFFMDKYEVTNARFARFLNANADAAKFVRTDVAGLVRTEKGWKAAPGLERHPVTAATGGGALAYAKWVGGHIPGRPEWEKAAGGAEGRVFPWGKELPDQTRANFGRPALRGPMPVGSFEAGVSPYGCYDMAGNVYDRVMMRGRPVMIKGGSWVSPHPLNLRVLDMCVQPMNVADRSVGFRCAMPDPEPDRATRKTAPSKTLTLARSWKEALAEAKKRGVPIFLSLQFDTCGQCDRTRAQLFVDPRFVAYCNEKMVVAVGHKPAPQIGVETHPENADGTCPLYPGLECWQHFAIFKEALPVVKVFRISPGNFVLDADGKILVAERELPKWGNPVTEYLAAFERARAKD